MKTNTLPKPIKNLALALLVAVLAGKSEHLQAAGLTSGAYRFRVPWAPVHLHGAYPMTIGDMTTNCVLSVDTGATGALSGVADVRSLGQTVTGEFSSKDGVVTIHVHVPEKAKASPASDLNGQLHGRQFVGTAQDSSRSALFTLDVGAAAPLSVRFDIQLTVNGEGQVSGSGTATVPGVVLPVTVTGTNSAESCSLHIVGTSSPQFVWDGSGPASYIGFTANYTCAGFGVSKSGTGIIVARKAKAPALLGNVSTRLRAQTGENVLIGGFIVTGTQAKKVIVRAIGPSLPVAGNLADPQLELHDSTGAVIAANNNWQESANEQAIIDSKVPPSNPNESAILTSLPPGAYTAIVSGAGSSAGVAVVEVYDLDSTVDSRLANISTRGRVETGDNVMIGGFFVLGTEPQKVIVRAIGPSLSVANKLTDPLLELHDPNGALLAVNDNWPSDQATDIIAAQIAPTNSKESAIVATLVPGPYTAVVRGANDSTGVAVVEVYALNP